MRLLHTSDWHLGRTFHGVGLLGAQERYLDHLVELVRTEHVDAVLVSGDVYDRALPAPDTVRLLSVSLERLVDAGTQVILSSGNHDSATRLGFAGGLLERAGVHVRTGLADIARPVVVGDVAIHPLPYLDPALAAGPLGTAQRTHAGVLRAPLAKVADSSALARHRVVMAHAFVAGGVGSASERDISVGGVGAVPAALFADMAYAALGHLHGPQEVRPGVRYSGSPVAMSFSEADHVKSSALVDLTGEEAVVTLVEAPVERGLAVLRGDLADLLAGPEHATAEAAWCRVTLTDAVRPLGAMDRIRARFPHTLELTFDPQGGAIPHQPYAERLKARDDLDVCCDFLGHVRDGAGASAEERVLLRTALDGSRQARRTTDDEGLLDDVGATSGQGAA